MVDSNKIANSNVRIMMKSVSGRSTGLPLPFDDNNVI